ncbi:MAG: hypothetical protein E7Z93_08105 [Cyanobacteria bacterium SIG32]|nr:hypothetical protein [Cyanobacteria bacterium SIG32]
MLTIAPISFKNTYSVQSVKRNGVKSATANCERNLPQNAPYAAYNINLASQPSFQQRLIGDIEFEEYNVLVDKEKEYLRYLYANFYELTDVNELHFKRDKNIDKLPLSSEEDMKDFLKVAAGYNKYREHKIICVGRSPKWFLNTSLWMKDGIENYSFAAFSGNWYRRNRQGLGPTQYKDESKMPTEKEYKMYKKYMKSLNCDPASIVKHAKKSGKPVIITDYIHSGCGLASYLDLMSRMAEEQGVLDEFAHSIKLFTMASVEYLDDMGYDNWYYYPRVILPERLKPYDKVIEQEYHDMSANVLKSILIDKNTNECRSTYYPHSAWTVYNPMKYKTGIISEEKLKEMPRVRDGEVNTFTDAMKDYRNLMNFRILDYLSENDLLKEKHRTR